MVSFNSTSTIDFVNTMPITIDTISTIKKKITSAITFKGYTVRASKEEPQYLIKSDTTDHLAMHKGSALTKLKK